MKGHVVSRVPDDSLNEISPGSSHFVSAASLRVRLDWFNKLRWGAVLGVTVAVTVAMIWLDYNLPLTPLFVVTGILFVLNAGYTLRNWRLKPKFIEAELRLVKMQMVADLVLLTVLLNLTGGIENPLFFLYVIHVILASLLFKGRQIFQIAWLAIILFTGEVLGEFLNIIPHHHLLNASSMTHELPFILMTLSSFWLVMLFSAYIGSAIMSHNRTIKNELVLRQKELIVKQSELVDADHAKMDFFRFVTHEVKSPVSTAQSAVETSLEVGGGDMAPPIKDLLERAVRRLEQTTKIVKDLADLTRSGKIKEADLREADMCSMINHSVDGLKDLALRRGIKIDTRLPRAPVRITTYTPMVERVVGNLLSNAVRYNSDDGSVSVTLVDLKDSVRLTVSDTGIGIAEEDQQRIFEEFYRSYEAQKMTNLGTGLGLPIVKKFMSQLGGSIDLTSVVGQGTTFTAEFPHRAKPEEPLGEKGGSGK
jgi:signal transduction histidine kinase